MSIDITVKIGGEAGQGIQTVGDLLALVCRKAGLYIMAINDYESRIRGGHSFFQIRIADKPVFAPHHRPDLLVALSRRTIELHENELAEGGLIMTDQAEEGEKENLVSIPINDLAVEAGGKITANTVAAGACLSLLGAPFSLYRDVLSEHFSKKSEKVIQDNIKAAELGYQAVENRVFPRAFHWDFGEPKGMLMDGAKAVAYGALAADCRVAAFYPMSPATGIMAELIANSDNFPIVVEQAEDEIAAVNMIIGASFAGARAMTSTSGGGFCLMTEGLGLAAMSETPVVIVNAQRPGPATGMPTRSSQSDLLFAIRASQDEFPRFVFAPGTVAEAYESTRRAFDLSEKYQVPAIVLTDHYMHTSVWLNDQEPEIPETIERYIAGEVPGDPDDYKRFAVTPSGISPRIIPCAGKALMVSTGNEHSEDGHISEAINDRIDMVDKRNAKMEAMTAEMRPPEVLFGDSGTLLAGWGTAAGAIREAVERLREEGYDAGAVLFTDIWPFPVEAVIKRLNMCRRFLMVEMNSTAQLGALIREQTGFAHSGAILKYDGRPVYPVEIVDGFKKIME